MLSDRVEVALFQYDRERNSWAWDAGIGATANLEIEVTGLPASVVEGPVEVVFRVSLSARIAPCDTAAVIPHAAVQVDVSVLEPSVMWLRSPEQLRVLSRRFRETLQRLAEQVPACRHIHLFYAGPAGGAITLGQAINPRMNPPVALYEHHRQRDPKYEHVLTLADP
jgi:hypothetical protein